MDKVSKFTAAERSELFKAAALRKGMKDAVVEKDFWVCWTLDRLFSRPDISRTILFKGGTSLSKVFRLIERFSEDIDLILDWRLLTDEDPKAKRSNTRQDAFNKGVNESAQMYIRDRMLPEMARTIGPLCSAAVSSEDPHIVIIKYPAAFGDKYIRPSIKLEIGPLASWIPHGEYDIIPYAAEAFPSIFERTKCKVKAIRAERTFWEKATILHQEASRPKGKPQPAGYSRHYYDTAMIGRSPVRNTALAELNLLHDVVEFKKQFYPRIWAEYDKAVPGTFRLVPPAHLMEPLAKDYLAMRDMIFGVYPDFGEIIETLRDLEREINGK